MPRTPVHPILSCEQALHFERTLLQNPQCEWEAMHRVGEALALAMLEDWRELNGSNWRFGGYCDGAAGATKSDDCATKANDSDEENLAENNPPPAPRVLVLVGKGHNGGDALLAATELARRYNGIEIVLYRTSAIVALRPLCRKAWEGLFALAARRSDILLHDASEEPPARLFNAANEEEEQLFNAGKAGRQPPDANKLPEQSLGVHKAEGQSLDTNVSDGQSSGVFERAYAFCIDGLLGMQFRPPLRQAEAALLKAVNSAGARIGLRAAVDLPSGLGEADAFDADFTYATAIAKRPLFQSANSAHTGRLRYLDIGFFCAPHAAAALASAMANTAANGVLLPKANTARSAVNGVTLPKADVTQLIANGVDSPQTAANGGALDAASAGALPALRVQVLTAAVLDPFRFWRSPFKDKRHYGHLFVLGGSAQMPGALLMNVQAALRSGAGLVTAFAPESVAHVFAAQAPEAMWVPWPQTDEGTLALEGQHLLAEKLGRATALLVGSGMGRSAETLALLEDVARTCDVPLVLDADALQPSVLAAAMRHSHHGAERPVIITPHGGEFSRLYAKDASQINDIDRADSLREFCREHGLVTVLKGAQTRVADAHSVAYSLFGGPVLARGGSGDVLAGLVGGCLVQQPQSPVLAAQQATCWHGLASQSLAREQGQISVTTMDLVRHLAGVIRNGAYTV